MADYDAQPLMAVPSEGYVTLTHVMYGLHAFSALMGIVTPVLIVTAFLTGWPSIIAVIINYVKRGEVSHTYLDSHFRWQIRTFWFAVLWFVVMGILYLTILGIVLAIPLGVVLGIWVLYRIIRGWLTLLDRKSMPL
jgi:uncharacterized membrane protein